MSISGKMKGTGTMFDLTGKTALVTGASGGIGGAIATALHDAGAVVGLSGTRVEPLAELADSLGDIDVKHRFLVGEESDSLFLEGVEMVCCGKLKLARWRIQFDAITHVKGMNQVVV